MGVNKKNRKYFKKNGDHNEQTIMPSAEKIGLDSESEVMKVCDTNAKKNVNVFANINHKKSFGANNWMTFLEGKSETNASNLGKGKNCNAHQTSETMNHNVHVVLNPGNLALDQSSNSYLHQKPTTRDPRARKLDEVVYKSSHANHQGEDNNCGRPLERRRNNTFKIQNKSNVKKTTSTKQIAMDCEMVGVEIGVKKSMLARISLVNALGDCIYDKYVKPTELVVDYRTRFSGIRPGDLDNASDFKIVQKEVADLIKGKILVGHALKNDLAVLFLSHPKHAIRDTSKYQSFRKGKAPALKKLAKQYLGVDIQEGEHNSIQDALAAMQLYRMFRREWEASIRVKRFKKQIYEDEKSKSIHTGTASNTLMNI